MSDQQKQTKAGASELSEEELDQIKGAGSSQTATTSDPVLSNGEGKIIEIKEGGLNFRVHKIPGPTRHS